MGCDPADPQLRALKDPPLPSGHTQAPIALAGPGCLSSSAFAHAVSPQGPTTPPLSASDLRVPSVVDATWSLLLPALHALPLARP